VRKEQSGVMSIQKGETGGRVIVIVAADFRNGS
jgi:hypothetical protein